MTSVYESQHLYGRSQKKGIKGKKTSSTFVFPWAFAAGVGISLFPPFHLIIIFKMENITYCALLKWVTGSYAHGDSHGRYQWVWNCILYYIYLRRPCPVRPNRPFSKHSLRCISRTQCKRPVNRSHFHGSWHTRTRLVYSIQQCLWGIYEVMMLVNKCPRLPPGLLL